MIISGANINCSHSVGGRAMHRMGTTPMVYNLSVRVADIVKVVSNDIVAAMIRDALAGVVMMIISFDVVELAVFDENPAVFAKQFVEDFDHAELLWLSNNAFVSLYPIFEGAV